MSTELVNRLTDEYRWMSTTTTTEELRSFVENIIEETKKHIAKTLVAKRANMLGALCEEGYIETENISEVERLILAALVDL
jgi:hypothetical protein